MRWFAGRVQHTKFGSLESRDVVLVALSSSAFRLPTSRHVGLELNNQLDLAHTEQHTNDMPNRAAEVTSSIN